VLRELRQFGLLDLLRRRLRLAAVDWAQPNAVLAAELGVGESRVSQLRRGAGAPRSRGGAGRRATWPTGVDWALHDREIGARVGRSRQAVNLMRQRLKAPLAAPLVKSYDWSGVDWRERVSEIARRLGCEPSSVRYQQRKRGMR